MSSHPRLIVREPNATLGPSCEGADCITLAEFRQALRPGTYFKMLRRYSVVELQLYSLATHGRLWPYALLLPPLSRGETVIRDSEGGILEVGPSLTIRLLTQAARDRVAAPLMKRRLRRLLDRVANATVVRTCDLSKPVLYLRTDFWFGTVTSGAVPHTAGIINNLGSFTGAPIVVTTDPIPTVADTVETHVVRPGDQYRNLSELRMVAFNDVVPARVEALLGTRQPGFVYQRSSLFNFSGLALAVRYSVPLVLEYNSSNVWNARNLGQPLRHEALADRIELANLHGADLVVVVSAALRHELVGRGVDRDKILVNPNGVDTDIYSPDVDGGPVRHQLGLEAKIVVGFIGLFSTWHGVEVLAEAFGRLIERAPELRESVRLLMVGDGVRMPEVVANLERRGVRDLAVLTGLVPQAEGAAHLAACDILASPHVPYTDGTPFFGSPMKIFEYMAMGRGIIASDLGQIGEVLEDGHTAVLAPPGDADALAAGMERLIRDPHLRTRLGAAARQEVVANYTWSKHIRRIIDALQSPRA